MNTRKMLPNRLISETSPYLQQHAHNPVDWHAYGTEAFDEAKRLNKPMLISIGYSSCHWCHVMERESFENDAIAKLMNAYFVCVKVDREERPDVDHAYMDAVHAMQRQGGWPLNCFALPDGRPFWGGTYFRPEQWKQVLGQIHEIYQNHYDELLLQAENIEKGIAGMQMNLEIVPENAVVNFEQVFNHLNQLFDHEKGGFAGAPKFPMPVVLSLLLNYSYFSGSELARRMAEITVDQMSRGGIYDQAGGGFARYSTDNDWKIPHFEKMLYDNAQLVSLLSKLFMATGNTAYKILIDQTLDFIKRELTSPAGLFYSSLDADSEGEEGLFYTFTEEEFKLATGNYATLMGEYFGIGKQGLWENGRNILLRPHDDKLFAQQHYLSETELLALRSHCCNRLLSHRMQKTPPATDQKHILSWNSLMAEAYLDAYLATGTFEYLQTAETTLKEVIRVMKQPSIGYFHSYTSGKTSTAAFLDDYAFLASALIKIYSATAEVAWLREATAVASFVVERFFDANTGFFWFSEPGTGQVFSGKIELYDGVIPSANAAFSSVLRKLGLMLGKQEWLDMADAMLLKMSPRVSRYPSSYAGWAAEMLVKNLNLVAITGPNALEVALKLRRKYLPGTLICASEKEDGIYAFKGKFGSSKSQIFICTSDGCLPAVDSAEEALAILNESYRKV